MEPVSCFAKTSNSASGVHPSAAMWPLSLRGQPRGDNGIDRTALFGVFGAQACDTRMLPTSVSHFPVAKVSTQSIRLGSRSIKRRNVLETF